jgi:uncharacterized protein YdeI (YjbR/CyaY-like superfamily)
MKETQLRIVRFSSAREFRAWLHKHYAEPDSIWIKLGKKGSAKPSITYAEALDEALCFGWIDSQVKKYDEESYLQKFSPRRPKSIWSKINVGHVERLIKEKRMMQSGLKEVEEAKRDGRFYRAYEPPSKAEIPADLQKIIDRDPKTKAFVATLSRSNINAISFRLTTAKKPETRARRLEAIAAMLKRGERFY